MTSPVAEAERPDTQGVAVDVRCLHVDGRCASFRARCHRNRGERPSRRKFSETRCARVCDSTWFCMADRRRSLHSNSRAPRCFVVEESVNLASAQRDQADKFAADFQRGDALEQLRGDTSVRAQENVIGAGVQATGPRPNEGMHVLRQQRHDGGLGMSAKPSEATEEAWRVLS